MNTKINNYCLNSFLNFRYVVDNKQVWTDGWKPWWPDSISHNQKPVDNEEDVISFLKDRLSDVKSDCGILLSGGIDSAILAALVPEKTKVFTIRFIAPGATDESIQASVYAKINNLEHFVVDVYWDDYLKYTDILLKHKKSPLHAIEVGIYKAAIVAKMNNVNKLIVGNGADSTFGGMDKLLSKDWGFQEFVQRYNFVNVKNVLNVPMDLTNIYEPYRKDNGINVPAFLKKIHGEGIIQTFCNAAETAEVTLIEPFEEIKYTKPLDFNRIRNGESKYVIRNIFKTLYPQLSIIEKIPFARPMDKWLAKWNGPENSVFRKDLDITLLTGEEKWLIYILDKFLKMIEK